MSVYLNLYKALLHLYPTSYRQEYESEMIQLFEDMLMETPSFRERILLLVNSLVETFKWSTPEVVAQTEANVLATPAFIKTASSASVLCIMPFLLAALYRLHMAYDHETQPALLNILVHTHSLYTSTLPIAGFVIAVSTAVWSIVHAERYWQQSWVSRLQSAWHNSLLVFCFISIAALAIII